jgi:hypothetical protein
MGRDLLAWVFHSPRRLLLVVVVPLLVVSVGPVLLSRLNDDDGAPAAATDQATAAATQSATPTLPGDQALPPATPPPDAVRVVNTFVEVWLAGATADTDPEVQEWHKRLAQYVTPELSTALKDTDPGRVPDASPTGPAQPLRVGEYLSELSVPMSDGKDLNLTIAWDGEAWRVSDIDREGGA